MWRKMVTDMLTQSLTRSLTHMQHNDPASLRTGLGKNNFHKVYKYYSDIEKNLLIP